jgi:hypothetical protein
VIINQSINQYPFDPYCRRQDFSKFSPTTIRLSSVFFRLPKVFTSLAVFSRSRGSSTRGVACQIAAAGAVLVHYQPQLNGGGVAAVAAVETPKPLHNNASLFRYGDS